MAENLLVDGKPLHLLRVIDLREELKKRNIKSSGTKAQLQEQLIAAIQQEALQQKIAPVDDINADKDSTTNEDNSNASSDVNSVENAESEAKVASISINEENETIKLTIRSSPRKSEQPPQHDSDTEASQSETDESNGSPPAIEQESIHENKNETPVKDKIDGNSNGHPAIEKSAISLAKVPVDVAPVVNHDEQVEDQTKESNSESNEALSVPISKPSRADNSTISTDNHAEKEDLGSKRQVGSIKKTELDKPRNNDVTHENSPAEPTTHSSPNKRSPRKRDISESAPSNPTPARRRLLSQPKSVNVHEQKAEEPIETKSKPSIRDRLLSHSKSINEEDSSKPVQKKRRWGSSQVSESSVVKKGISSDELRVLISESNSTENDIATAKVSKAVSEEESAQPTNAIANKEPEPKEEEIKKVVDASVKPSADSNEKIEKSEPLVVKETQSEESERAVRGVSPAKSPESTVLFVSGLVRPFTLPALKKLLTVHGTIDEEKFWIDKIRSKCYVVYQTVEEANKTREALHHLKWPQSSPKNLAVDFATLEDIDRCQHPENYEDLPPPRNASPPMQQQPQKPVNDKASKKEKNAVEISQGKVDIIKHEPMRESKTQGKNSVKDDAPTRNVREWDRNKVNLSGKRENEDQENRKRARYSAEREPIPEKKEKTREMSRSPDVGKRNEQDRETNRKSESPVKMLEDLFRKTKASPYIYWLPLTEEQALEKEKLREAIEKDKLARIAARRESGSKRENSPPSRPALAHQNFPRDRQRFQQERRPFPPFPPRRKRSISPSPRRGSAARNSRSRSPDPRRFSPRRRR